MEMLKPKKFKKGMTIGLLTVSGAVKNTNEIEIAKKRLEDNGYKVVISDSTYSNYRDMAGTKAECLKNLYDFFKNPKIDAIINTRGGYGTLRFLKDIDYSVIKNNPKIFIGYSDVTTLLSVFSKNAGLTGFYGAMALSDFASDYDEIAFNNMMNALTGNIKKIIAENHEIINKGACVGKLWGGNLSTLASMCGLDFIPDEDFIFFMEDWHDPVYKLDRMFTQLLNIDKFKNNLKGIVWGEFLGVDDEKEFLNWQEEISNELKIPMSKGFKITHGKNKLTIPFGVKASFNATNGEITILEEYLS